jgi:hypothetical protein
LPQQVVNLPAFPKGFACIPPVLDGILVTPRRARTRRAAMHAATSFTLNGWRPAGITGPSPSPAAGTSKHRSGVALMVAGHFINSA